MGVEIKTRIRKVRETRRRVAAVGVVDEGIAVTTMRTTIVVMTTTKLRTRTGTESQTDANEEREGNVAHEANNRKSDTWHTQQVKPLTHQNI